MDSAIATPPVRARVAVEGSQRGLQSRGIAAR